MFGSGAFLSERFIGAFQTSCIENSERFSERSLSEMLGNDRIFRSAHTYKYLHFFGTPLWKNVEIFRTLMLRFAKVKTRQQERAKMRFLLVRSCFDGADRAAGTARIGLSSV